MAVKTKVLHAVFAVAFVLILLTPLLFIDLTGEKVSEWERRTLAAYPRLADALRHPRGFIEEFDAWFSDHVGFRENSIGLYRELIQWSGSGHYQEGSHMVFVGKDGYCYYGGIMADWGKSREPDVPLLLSTEQLQSLAEGLLATRVFLKDRDIPLIVVFCADKEDVYPEYYPKSIIYNPDPIQLDIVAEYVKSYTGIDLFNTKECLLLAKANYEVFNKDGNQYMLTHYNEIGAFFAYRELMKHIRTYIPKMEVLSLDDIEITYANIGIYPDIPDVCLKKSGVSVAQCEQF